MTAEVAIMNRFGIAIAADSAVTIGNRRVWKSTNKIFSLEPTSDIAIMIYGGGAFVGCPWEIVIKRFKEQNIGRNFEKLEDIVVDFEEFLKDDCWNSDIEETVSFCSIFVKELEEINNTLEYSNIKEFRADLRNWLANCSKSIDQNDICINDLSFKKFVNLYSEYISSLANDIFEKHIPKNLLKEISRYLFEYIRRAECVSGNETGVVFAGYGRQEKYPVVSELIVDGRCNGTLRAWMGRTTDLNVQSTQLASVIPFAQRDMANVFMEGISSSYVGFFFKIISGLLKRKSDYIVKNFFDGDAERKVEKRLQEKENKEILSDITSAYQSWRNETSVNPLMDSIRNLPREEMSAMAEALVELTSLRRKIDSNVQSVAGPVDVAFISKGDGVIWMKRKHYFDPKLNGDFFDRRRDRYGG